VAAGHYVEVGANHPLVDSVSRAFYDRGWSGVTVEPVPAFAALQREQRPRDRQVEAAVTSAAVPEVVLHVFPDTGLSTLVNWVSDRHEDAGRQAEDLTVPTARLDDILAGTGFAHDDIHFMLIDVEGAEADVLSTVDLTVWRPWVLVIEATVPNSVESTADTWEPMVLAAGYEFCLFDGLSRFYVAEEHSDLRPLLSYPACPLDRFTRYQVVELLDRIHAEGELLRRMAELQSRLEVESEALRKVAELQGRLEVESEALRKGALEANRQLLYWRSVAVRSWGTAMAASSSEFAALKNEAAALGNDVAALKNEVSVLRGTISWRVTAPLRKLRAPLRKVRNAQRAVARRVR
jgi:FkbM family methyltransferase